MAYNHIIVGNINIDITFYISSFPKEGETIEASEILIAPGGAAANYSIACSRAGHRPILIAHYTNNKAMEIVLKQLENEGVETSLIELHDEMPGFVVILVTGTGSRTMIKHSGANKYLSGSEIEKIRDRKAKVIHAASIDPLKALRAFMIGKELGFTVRLLSYDPGGSVARKYKSSIIKTIRESKVKPTTLFINRLEAMEIFNTLDEAKILEYMDEARIESIVVKMGEYGAKYISRTHSAILCVEPYRPGRVIDTTGAGDVFDAYFNAILIEKNMPEKALVYASIASGLKVSKRGAGIAAPRRNEVEVIVSKNPPRVLEC